MRQASTAVAVVIPCFNGARYLSEAIASVQQQSAVEQLIVVDDGSTDDSAAVAKSAGADVVTTSGRTGPSNARNVGVTLSRAPLVAFLDADDIWKPDHLAVLLEQYHAQPAQLVGGSTVTLHSPADHQQGTAQRGAVRRVTLPDLLRRNPFAQSAVLVERSAFLAAGGYRAELRYAEDYDLWMRMAVRGGVLVACDSRSCRRRIHPDQASLALGAMKRNAWRARFDAVAESLAGSSEAMSEEFQSALADALHADMVDAWYVGDVEAHDALQSLRRDHEYLDAQWRRSAQQLGPWWLGRVRSRIRELAGR